MSEEKTLEDIERVELPGSTGGENAEESEDSKSSEGTVDETSKEEVQPKEQLVQQPEKPTVEKKDEESEKSPAPVEGETPRERALRQKLETTERENRRLMAGQLKIDELPPSPKKELPADKAEVLARYKPEEIGALREVLPVLAEEMGYIKADQLTAQQHADKSQEILDDFLKDHKEYLPENDKDGVLWEEFKKEFSRYRPPQDPKEYSRIFNRIHTDIFGIKPVGDKGAITAAQKKIQVASHAGASGPTRQVISSRRSNTSGIRMDMLKGFSDEEKAEMAGED